MAHSSTVFADHTSDGSNELDIAFKGKL